MKFLCVIQARLGSKRFPNKVMQMVNGKTMLRRVWDAAKESLVDHVIVAWPERWPDIEETDLHTKFCLLAKEYRPRYIVRLTADCPLITASHINDAILEAELWNLEYFNNGLDGYDVQVFTPEFLKAHPNKEHVLEVPFNTGGVSVNTKADLERVRLLAK